MDDFRSRYQELEREVADVCRRCGRSGGVKILAVSKTFPASAVEEAYQAGVRMFGENRVQELAEKAAILPPDIEWHFIGHLQSNKAAKAVEFANWIHSVDSIKLLNKINTAAGNFNKKINILIEVNSGEENKSGVSYENLDELVQAAIQAPNVQLQGLMTMAPLCSDPEVWNTAFHNLAAAKTRLEEKFNTKLPELSMGMSGDFPCAINNNTTIIRIGTRLFGGR